MLALSLKNFPTHASKQEALQLYTDLNTRPANRTFAYLISYQCGSGEEGAQTIQFYEAKVLD